MGSKFKATHTQAPNFAYALATRKFKEGRRGHEGLNLSAMKHMINAAEPADAVAIDDFYTTFGVFGLPRDVVIPTYGLAEHTVFVCSGGKQQLVVRKAGIEARNVEIVSDDAKGYMASHGGEKHLTEQGFQCIVGCGYPKAIDDVDLRIVDTESTQVLPDDRIGEIWIHSPSKAQGYFGKPDLTLEEFKATPSSGEAKSPEGYLKTGDLGFLHCGELFICGRSKDLIIVRGSNHYPQDIERTVEKADPRLRPGCSAAFSLTGNQSRNGQHTESVIYVAEVKDQSGQALPMEELAQIVKDLRKIVAADHGVAFSNVCLLRQKSVPKTTSGKIARSWCRKAFLEGKLDILYRWDSPVSASTGDDVAEETDEFLLLGDDEARQRVLSSSAGAAELRALSVGEIASKLEQMLLQVSSQSPEPLEAPIDRTAPLMSLGLDR